MGHTLEDLMFLFGRHTERHKRQNPVKIRAENDWLDGKNADDNPYPARTAEHYTWFSKWLECNKNC